MGDPADVGFDSMVAALNGTVPPLPGRLLPEQEGIAAAGAWGPLGSMVVLRREDDGLLVDDTHLLVRDQAGRWAEPGSSAGSGISEWVLGRPSGAFEPWHGAHQWVFTSQLAVVAGHGWCGDVTVMVSQAVTTVEFVHAEERHRVSVPASGLVTVARPVRSWREEVLVRALDRRGVELAYEVYPFLTDSDHGWPDPGLWVGHWSQEGTGAERAG